MMRATRLMTLILAILAALLVAPAAAQTTIDVEDDFDVRTYARFQTEGMIIMGIMETESAEFASLVEPQMDATMVESEMGFDVTYEERFQTGTMKDIGADGGSAFTIQIDAEREGTLFIIQIEESILMLMVSDPAIDMEGQVELLIAVVEDGYDTEFPDGYMDVTDAI